MSAPVRHTCPDIDKVIDKIKAAIKTAEYGKKITESGSELYYCFDEIIYEIDYLESMLEGLRSDNDSLRSWGHDLEKQLAEVE